MDMLEAAVMLIGVGFIVWLVIFILTLLKPGPSSRHEIGGGLTSTIPRESWSSGLRKKTKKLKDWDIKLLNKLSNSGESNIDDIIAYLQEQTPSIAERLSRLEAKGYIMKTQSGSIIITEKGRKYIESIREKLWYRRKEKELLEKSSL